MAHGETPNTARYPWSVLDMEGPGDSIAIRRAYARKLKTTRPDEDPEGFQELVAAREAAMAMTQMHEHAVDAEMVNAAIAVAPSEIEPTQKADEASEGLYLSTPSETPPVPTAECATPLRQMLTSHPAYDDLEVWQNILTSLDKLPLLHRRSYEQDIIQALYHASREIGPSPTQLKTISRKWTNWRKRRLIVKISNEVMEYCRPFFEVVLILSDQFDWKESDMPVHLALLEHPGEAQEFLYWLRSVRLWHSATRGEHPIRKDENGLYLFAAEDIKRLSDVPCLHAVTMLGRRRQCGSWAPGMWGGGFLLAPAYLSAYFPVFYMIGWSAFFTVVTIVTKVVIPPIHMRYEWDKFTIAVCLLLLVLHVGVGLVGYRGILAWMDKWITCADRNRIFDRRLRAAYFATVRDLCFFKFCVGLAVVPILFLLVNSLPILRLDG